MLALFPVNARIHAVILTVLQSLEITPIDAVHWCALKYCYSNSSPKAKGQRGEAQRASRAMRGKDGKMFERSESFPPQALATNGERQGTT